MRNKFLKGVTSLGIASAICLACGVVTASAAITDDANVSIHYGDQKLIVDFENDEGGSEEGGDVSEEADTPEYHEVLFGVSTVSKKNEIKTAAWEVYEVPTEAKTVEIDLSSLNTQKDNYVQIKGDADATPVTIFIPATDKKLKVKFDATAKTITTEYKGDLQYRTQYGSWNPFYNSETAKTDLSVYQQRGATLYFRQATGEAKLAKVDVKDVSIKETNGDTTVLYNADSLPGKEIKVAVAKLANGPKVAANYVKNTVVIPKGAKYRINLAGSPLTATWTEAAAKVTLDAKDASFASLLAKGGSVEAFTPAKGKKADSKISHIDLGSQGEVAASDIVASAKEGKKEGTWDVTIENKSDAKYEVIIKSGEEAPAVGDKITKAVAAGKSITLKNQKADDIVWVHKVGDAKKSIWSTGYASYGKTQAPEFGGAGGGTVEETTADKLNKIFTDLFASAPTIEYTAKNQVLDFLNSGKSVTWGASADYTVGEETIEGVTINVTAVSDTTMYDINEVADMNEGDATPVYVTVASSKFTAGTVDVTVTLAKDDETVTKTVTITMIDEE